MIRTTLMAISLLLSSAAHAGAVGVQPVTQLDVDAAAQLAFNRLLAATPIPTQYTNAMAAEAAAPAISAEAATRAANDAANAALAASKAAPADVTAAVAAATPAPCSVPAADTLTGSAGSAPTCMTRSDATRPTAVQRANATTDASGNFTLTWSRTFGSSSPVISVKPVIATGTKGDCTLSTVNAMTASGSCYTYQSVTVSILGATVNPIATAAAGIRVMLVGGEPTQ